MASGGDRSVAELRALIDELDRGLIDLLARRRGLTDRLGEVANPSDTRFAERFLALLAERRGWAEQAGLDPGPVELVFTLIVHGSIERLLQQQSGRGRRASGHWHRPGGPSAP